jgi:hypothetical protein
MSFDPWISEWGNPPDCFLLLPRLRAWWLSGCITRYFYPEYIGVKEQTRGTETSKYPEERKSTDTPLVVASERGPAEP